MKNRDLHLNPYPTTAELYALERAAKAARAAEMARLMSSFGRAAVRGVKTLFTAPEASKGGLKHA